MHELRRPSDDGIKSLSAAHLRMTLQLERTRQVDMHEMASRAADYFFTTGMSSSADTASNFDDFMRPASA